MELGKNFKIKNNNGYYFIVRKLFGILPIYLQYVSDEYVDKHSIKHKWKFFGKNFNPEKFKNENDAAEFILVVLCDIGKR